jgi:syntaxin 5
MGSRGTIERTREFFALSDARCRQQGRAPVARQRAAKTSFGDRAVRLGRALHTLETRTSRLRKLATKSSLFDDPAAEISEISVAVREELGAVATGLDALASAPQPGGRQTAAHFESVLAWLRARMANVTGDFQAALKQREATISAKESRAAKLSGISSLASPFAPSAAAVTPSTPAAAGSGTSSASASAFGSSGGRVVAKPQLLQRRRPAAGGACSTPPTHSHKPQHHSSQPPQRAYHDLGAAGWGGSPEPGTPGWTDEGASTPQQLQHFWTPRSQKHREQEVNAMQSTLAELGGLFQRFGALVSQQGEMIERIDANVEVAAGNIGEAHSNIQKYQRSMKGNRGLIIKTFAVLFFIIIIYSTVAR